MSPIPLITPFTFAFDAVCESVDTVPYAAKLTWNAKLQRVEHRMFPLLRTPSRVQGQFEAFPMDILEFRLGQYTRKRQGTIERRAWYLVVRQGYLVLVGDAQDPTAFQRVQQYLAGTLGLHELSQGHWEFDNATSDWPAINRSYNPGPTHHLAWLRQRRTALLHEIQTIDELLAGLAQPKDDVLPEGGAAPPSRNTDVSDPRSHP